MKQKDSIAEAEDGQPVEIEQSRGEETEFGQREWHRAGNTVKRTESDKLASLTYDI